MSESNEPGQKTLKLAGYSRVSTAEQVKGYSIDAQIEEQRKWANERHGEIERLFTEPGQSAKTDNRPVFQAMIRYVCASAEVDGILVHKSDRFARNLLDYLTYRAKLEANGKRLFSVTEPFLNDNSPESTMVAAIIAAVAQYVAENIGRESMKGRHQKAISGKWHGSKPPLGYVRDEDKNIIMHPVYGPMIQTAFQEFSTGQYTLTEWTKEAQKRGLTNDKEKPISRRTWWGIFRNIFYTGRYEYKGTIYVGDHPALIDLPAFEALQTLIAGRNTGGSQVRHYWLLKGLLWSKPYHRVMTGTMAKGKYVYYRAKKGKQVEHVVKAQEMEANVVDLVVGLFTGI